MSANLAKLESLNAFRTAEGLSPFADWRKARHEPLLSAYVAKKEAEVISLAQVKAAKEETNAKKSKTPRDTTVPSYKLIWRAAPATSTIMSPVKRIHEFLDANIGMPRKSAVNELVKLGINYSTARTQYQHWFTKRKAVSA